MYHLPTLPLLVSVRLTWLCFQLQRREPLLCKQQLLHLYTSWQSPLTFYHIHPHCPPKMFQRCLHGSHCSKPKHRQKFKSMSCLKIYSPKVYIAFIYVFSRFICFTLPELLSSLPTKKEEIALQKLRRGRHAMILQNFKINSWLVWLFQH